jgi:hypothetical protein
MSQSSDEGNMSHLRLVQPFADRRLREKGFAAIR